MSERDAIQTYLETVAAQIRWKRARSVIIPELEQHLEDQRDAFAAEGHENAEQLAAEEMGDPVPVGMELDRLHRPKAQWDLLSLTVLFTLSGTLLRIWLTQEFEQPLVLYRTLCSLLLGFAALLLGYFFDYTGLGRHGRTIYLSVLGISILALFLSPAVNGFSYYTRYVILCYPLLYAFWLYTWRKQGWRGLVCSLLGGIPLGILCLLTPYLFGLMMLAAAVLVLTASAAWNDWFGIGRKKSLFCVISCTLLAAGAALWYTISSEHVLKKLITAVHPEQDPFGRGYRTLAIRKVLAASQWIGTGNWDRDSAHLPLDQTLPEYDSDAFLTTLVYHLGWLPSLLVLSVFLALIIWLLCRCSKQKSTLGKWVVLSVITTLSLQAGCSILWSFGCPLMDASFPLIIGNLNAIIHMWQIGLALSVFRGERIFRDSGSVSQPRSTLWTSHFRGCPQHRPPFSNCPFCAAMQTSR